MAPKKKTKKKETPSNREIAQKLPGIPLGEVGSVGLREYKGFVEQAYNKTLFWPYVYPEYSRLRRSMPEMGIVRQLFTVLGRSVNPTVELPEKPTDDDKRYRDFVESEFDNMEGGFNQLLETMVSQVPFMGWGRWSIVPGVRDPDWKPPQKNDEWRSEEDDGLIGIRRLAWRDQGTLEKWEFDEHKRMIGMWQRDWNMVPSNSIYLPNGQCLHLTFGDPNNPEGLAPLEAIYRLERIRYGLEVIQGIGFEHAAGYLDVTKEEGGTLSLEDTQNIERAAMNIMTAKEGNYATWPPGITGSLKDVGFQAAGPLLSAIQHYSILSLSIYMAQFVAFNTLTGTGSYASSSDSSQMTITSFNSMMEGFAAQIDKQIGIKWWTWNKEAFPGVTKRPKLKFSKVEKETDLGVLGQFIGQIKDTIPLGEEDLAAIRKQTGFLSETLPEESEVINKQTLTQGQEQPTGLPGEGSFEDQPSPNGSTADTKVTQMMRAALIAYSRNGKSYEPYLEV